MIPVTFNNTEEYKFCKYNDSLIILPDDAIQPCCSMDLFNKSLYNKIKCDKNAKSINYEIINNISQICNYHSCANYSPVDYVPQYTQIALNNWQKCVGKCVSCYNYDNDYRNERALTETELDEFLTMIGDVYGAFIEKNKQALIASNSNDELVIPVLTITGSADLFYSENFHNILKTDLTKYGIQRVKLITNFQTFTNHNLDSIHPNTKKLIDTIMFSLDGINKEMYEKIRNGSKWENVARGYENMITHFPNLKVCQVNTVLSKWNIEHFKEFPTYIKDNFPAVNKLTFSFVSRWTENKIFDELLLDNNDKTEVINWVEENKNNFDFEINYY